MTKFNHENPYREVDAGAVRSVPDVTRPYKPPKSESDRKREQAEQKAAAAVEVEAIRPELERQQHRDARKQLKRSNLAKKSFFRSLLESQAAIPKPPNRKG